MTRVAVDILGYRSPPVGAFDAVLSALDADPDLVVTIVGPPEQTGRVLADRGVVAGDRVLVAPASRSIGPGADTVRAVRAHRDASVRVAARLVRDARADAMVSLGPPEAVVSAAHFTLGLVPGATRPALGAVLDGRLGPVVLSDAGAATASAADELAQFAVVGAAYATARLGVAEPRVGLVSARPALADPLRRTADVLLGSLGFDYVGPVSAGAVLAGDGLDVAVTDGFTGDVLLAASAAIAGPARSAGRAAAVPPDVDPAWGAPTGGGPGGNAVVLGIEGVVVCAGLASAHRGNAVRDPAGRPPPGSALAVDALAVDGLAEAIAAAGAACRAHLVVGVRSAMARLLERRRAMAGIAQ